MRVVIASCLAILAAGACHTATGPDTPRSAVLVQRDTLIATTQVTPSAAGPSITWVEFTAPYLVANHDTRPIDLDFCGTSVEQPVAGEWRTVWTPVCVAALVTPGPPLLPGETRNVSLHITAAIQGPGGPDWRAETIDGVYRLTVQMRADNKSGVIPSVASNSFVLVRH